jgi:hypothetical protein
VSTTQDIGLRIGIPSLSVDPFRIEKRWIAAGSLNAEALLPYTLAVLGYRPPGKRHSSMIGDIRKKRRCTLSTGPAREYPTDVYRSLP